MPVEQVNEVVTCLPTHFRRCGERMQGTDAEPLPQQVVEVPPVTPHVTEYQVHRLGIVNLRLTECEMIQYMVFGKIMTAICCSHVRL